MTTLDSDLLESVEKDYFDDPRVMALVNRFRCAQYAQLPPLPKNLHSLAGMIWPRIMDWYDAEAGEEAELAAQKIYQAIEEQMQSYAKEALRLNGVNV